MSRVLFSLVAAGAIWSCASPAGLASISIQSPARFLETYVTFVAGPEGPLDVTNRFLTLGTHRSVALLPDTAFCHVYFALAAGTYCYRARAEEPFQTKRVDALAIAGAAEADTLLRIGLGHRYGIIRELLLIREFVAAERLRCTSFFVNQVFRSLDDATFENFHLSPTGLREEGLVCQIDGKVYTATDSAEAASYQVWDLFKGDTEDYLVLLRAGDEFATLELYKVTGVRLSRIEELELCC